MQQTHSWICTNAGTSTTAGAVSGALGGGLVGAKEGARGVVAGIIIGGLAGAGIGYLSSPLTESRAIGAGAAGGVFAPSDSVFSNAYGGALGGATAYQLQLNGYSATTAGLVGGATGGGTSGALSSFFNGGSLADIGTESLSGAVIGLVVAGANAGTAALINANCK